MRTIKPISSSFLLLLGSLMLAADTAFTKLQVQSAPVDLTTHRASIELFNRSGDKTVAAYTLRIQEFDAADKVVTETQVGFDYLYYPIAGIDKNADPRERNLIGPGTSFTYIADTQPDTASIKASVLTVVYMDRSLEGNAEYAQEFFTARSQNEEELRGALSIAQIYPSSPRQLAATIQNLRNSGRAVALLTNDFHLGQETYSALMDKSKAVPAIEMPSKQKWNALISDLTCEAGFWHTESREARK